nr:hypothetical protein [Tanacetum cinerariifolium]
MDNKKHIVNLESFKDMLHICLRVHGQSFDEPSFEEEILAFFYFLGHNAAIRTLTDVNINKIYHPWRSFAAIINKCLTGKSSGYNSLRLSQAQILWGLYHKRNIDYAYLLWEDFVYQVEHKNTKKSNEMSYPRFTKVIIHYFMSKNMSIPKRNKVNWHYVRDDHMFFTIKLVSRHHNTQQFGALLPIELTNEEIRNSNAYKEYYAIATRAAPPKPKASARRTRSSSDTSITPPTAASLRLTASIKGKQTAKASKAKSLSAISEDGDDDEEDEGDDGQEGNGDDGDDDEDDDGEEGDNDDADQEVVRDDDKDDEEEGNGKEDLGLNIGEEERHIKEEEEDKLYRDININQGRGLQASLKVEDSHVTLTPVNLDGQQQSSSVSSQFVASMLNSTLDVGMESIFETSQLDVQTPTSVAPLPMSAPTMTPFTIATITTTSQEPILPTTVSSNIIQNLPNFGSLFRFDDRLRNLYKALVKAYESDKIILDTYGEIVTLKRRRDDDVDKDEEPSVGPDWGSKRRREGKEPESASAPTETTTRSAGRSTKGSRSRQASTSESALAEEPIQTTSQIEEPSDLEFDTGAEDQPIVQSSQHPECIQPWISKLAKKVDTRSSFNKLMDTPLDFSNFLINRLKVDTLTLELLAGPTYELMKGSCKSLVELEYHLEEFFKATTDQLDWFNPEGQQYLYNLLKSLPLIPNNQGRHVIPFEHFINNNLEYLRGGASSCYDKHALWGVSHWGRERQQFYGFAVNWESARDVYSKRRIIAATELKIVKWHSYKHLDWITKHRDPEACGRPSTGCQKLPEEAQPNKAGFNKDKRNRLMRIDELHKFSDGTLINVRTALDDRLKGIRMSILTDLQVTPTKPGRMIKPYSSHRFIANCSNAGNIKIEVK